MKRVRRILPVVAVALSLLLFITTVLLWVRSRWACDFVTVLSVPRFEAMVCSQRGGIEFLSQRRHSFSGDPYAPDSLFEWRSFPPSIVRPLLDRGRYPSWQGGLWRGFGWERWTMPVEWGHAVDEPPAGGSYTIDACGIVLPHWVVALLTGAPAIRLRMARRRARRRMRHGFCPGCGYDIRSTPERCPECGRKMVDEASR